MDVASYCMFCFVMTIALMVLACCGGVACVSLVLTCIVLGVKFFISSLMASVLSMWGNVIVPFAVSSTA